VRLREVQDWQPYLVAGRRIVSVTEALNLAGVRRLVGYDEAQTAWRGLIGSAVHKATAFMDINRFTWDAMPPEIRDRWDSVSPEVAPYSRAWTEFKIREGFVPRRVEYRIAPKHGSIQFGMTLDREGLLRGVPYIIDLKTPKKQEPWWGVQLAGYELGMIALHAMPAEPPFQWKRAALRLTPESSPPYRLIPYEDPVDFDVFRWALGISVWAKNNYPNAL